MQQEEYLEQLHAIFTTISELSSDTWEDVKAAWVVPKKLQRNDFLLSPGQVGQHLYYVKKGAMKYYYLHEGEEICIGFAYPGTVAVAYPSFIKKLPTKYYMQAINACELVGITRQDFYDIVEKHPSMERCWRMLAEEALLGKIERELEMLTFTPEERFKRLFERSPHLFQLIPQKYIASYLRMKPETLSRIKKRVW
ncbi:MAG: Crp/Fnr family transcriptional regulator [Aureispira sp.]|nr:Crp/Fnr family transcriptional regulator [Aureispira sp.]